MLIIEMLENTEKHKAEKNASQHIAQGKQLLTSLCIALQ